MLVERETELDLLSALFERTQRGGAIGLVLGEAGIGKSSLIQSFIEKLDPQTTVVWGLCDAMFTPRPLGPVIDIATALQKSRALLSLADLQADRLFPSVLADLAALGRPAIMVIEDVHWADHGTLDFIRYLGRRLATLPVLLIVSYRDDEIGPEHPLFTVLGDLPSSMTNRLELAPLSQAGVAKLSPHTMTNVDAVYRATGGNPFFVTELIASSEGEVSAPPASVKEAVNARLSRVAASERKFLEFASLIPGAIDPKLINPAFDGDAETLALACVGRGLLKQDREGKLWFRHELARLATAARVRGNERQKIHARVLSFLLAAPEPPLDAIVHHAAGAIDGKAVLEYAPVAAAKAAKIGAHREAAKHLATALEFVSEAPPDLAAQLHEDWAYEAALALKIDDEVIEARRHAISLWRALGRKDKVGANLRWLSRLHWYRGEAAKAAQLSDEALRILEDEGPSIEKAMAYSLQSQLHMLNDRMDEAIETGQHAIDMAEEFNGLEVRVHALNNIGTAKLFRGNRDGLEEMYESLALAEEASLHEDVARVYTNLAEYAVEFKDFDLAEKSLADGIAFDTKHDLDSWTYYLVGRLAQLRLEQGRLIDAETIASGALNRPNQTLLMELPALIVLAIARLRLGRPDARRLLADALQNALATDELQYIIPVRIAYLESAVLNGSKPEATEHYHQLVSLPSSSLHQWRKGQLFLWGTLNQFNVPDVLAVDIAPPHQAIRRGDLQAAAERFEALGLVYYQAVALSMRSDEASIVKAHQIFSDIQARPMLEATKKKAAELGFSASLLRTRRGPYSSSRSHPLGLTRREQDVLAELIRGATNQEIADTLSRSRRTVENHVSSILTKMNVSTRADVILKTQMEPWLAPHNGA